MKEIDGNCKVIIDSGLVNDEELTAMKKNGLAGFIQKPFHLEELSRVIAKTIRT